MPLLAPVTTTNESKQQVRKLFNIQSQKQVDEIVGNLRVWVKKNAYPEELQDEKLLEQFLLRAKFDETKCQKNLTTFVNNVGTHYKFLQKLVGPFELRKEQGVVVSSLTLTSNLERIILIKMSSQNVPGNNLDFERVMQLTMACAVIDFHNDYPASLRFVLDFDQVKIAHFKNVKFSNLSTMKGISENVFKERISGVEIINASTVFSCAWRLIKMALPAKVFSRARNHENLESLYKHVDRKFLPREYGGTQWSLDLMIDEWDKAIRENQAVLKRMAQLSKKVYLEEQTKEVRPSFQYLTID